MTITIENIKRVPVAASRNRTGLTAAFRELAPGKALFITADGMSLTTLQTRIAGIVTKQGGHTRVDRTREGVWAFRD